MAAAAAQLIQLVVMPGHLGLTLLRAQIPRTSRITLLAAVVQQRLHRGPLGHNLGIRVALELWTHNQALRPAQEVTGALQ